MSNKFSRFICCWVYIFFKYSVSVHIRKLIVVRRLWLKIYTAISGKEIFTKTIKLYGLWSLLCYYFLVKPACGERDIVVTISFQCMCVHCARERYACVRPSVPPDLFGTWLLHLCMNFTIICHSCSPWGVEVPFETFVQVGWRSRSHLQVKWYNGHKLS